MFLVGVFELWMVYGVFECGEWRGKEVLGSVFGGVHFFFFVVVTSPFLPLLCAISRDKV